EQNYLACTLGEKVVSRFHETPPEGSSSEDCRVAAHLPHQMEFVPDGYFDLVINVSSFDEMSPQQVERYFSLINKKCRGWLYLKGHARSRSIGNRLGLDEFPYEDHWTQLYCEPDPLVESFAE